MPTEEKNQHDFITERRFDSGRTVVSLEEFLLGVIVEKEKRYEEHFRKVEELITGVERKLEKHEEIPGHPMTRSDINVLTSQVQASNTAVRVAMEATEHRLEGLNELRRAMIDQQGAFARKDALEISLKAITDKIALTASLQDASSGRSLGISSTLTALGVVVALLLSLGELIVLLVRH